MFHVKHREMLTAALKSLKISYTEDTIEKLRIYHDLIAETNKHLNLISKNDTQRIIEHHFLDSIGFAKYVDFSKDTRVMDLGSGAGLPGIIISILFPNLPIVLVESKRKRALFLKDTISVLSLNSVSVVCDRAENLNPSDYQFSTILIRSVAGTSILIKWSTPLLIQNIGKIVTVKGPDFEHEISALNKIATKYSISGWDTVKFDPFPQILKRPARTLAILYKGDN